MKKLVCGVIAAVMSLGAASEQCDYPGDVCAAQEAFERADDALGLMLESINIRINDDEFEEFLVDPAELTSSLKQSQTAWEVYQAAHCAAVFRLMSGGTSAQVDELTCLADLADARTAQLQALYGAAADLVTDDDLSWLNGVWFERCESGEAAYQFYVTDDRVYAEVAPDEISSDPGEMAEAEILLAQDGFVEVTPFGWDNTFLRIKPAGGDRIVGDVFEVFSDATAPLETVDLVQCPVIRDGVE